MDIKTVYPGEQPAEADFLWGQTFAEEGFGFLLRDLVGSGTYVAGLACTPTSPASMTVNVGPGRIYSLQNLRATGLGQIAGLGGLPADTNPDHQIMKQGLLRDTTVVGGGGSPFTAPTTSGQSINYLIQAQFVETDSTAVQRTFYNTQNPDVAIPSDVSEFRQCKCQLSVKAGSPATTGSQVTPTADAGCVPVWVVTVAYGQTSISSGNIAQHPSAPLFSLVTSSSGLAVVTNGVLSVSEASPADIRAGTSTGKVMTPGDTFSALAPVALTDAATITPDFSAGINFSVTLGGNRTLANPANAKTGQSGWIAVTQDATGSRTLTPGSSWKRPGGWTGLSTAAGVTDYIFYEVISPTLVLYSLLKSPS